MLFLWGRFPIWAVHLTFMSPQQPWQISILSIAVQHWSVGHMMLFKRNVKHLSQHSKYDLFIFWGAYYKRVEGKKEKEKILAKGSRRRRWHWNARCSFSVSVTGWSRNLSIPCVSSVDTHVNPLSHNLLNIELWYFDPSQMKILLHQIFSMIKYLKGSEHGCQPQWKAYINTVAMMQMCPIIDPAAQQQGCSTYPLILICCLAT